MYLEGNIAAVRTGHAYIEQDHVGTKLAGSTKGLRGRIFNFHLEHAGLFQSQAEQSAASHIIIHDENFRLAHKIVHPSLTRF